MESYLVVERKGLVFFTWASIDGAEQVMTAKRVAAIITCGHDQDVARGELV
ncbi:MAG: hypothetical protein J2P48_24215 [Alphaproteobacteria bacterium]|nr:hypothetical protein [Alphaproteobacteria bacterium]